MATGRVLAQIGLYHTDLSLYDRPKRTSYTV